MEDMEKFILDTKRKGVVNVVRNKKGQKFDEPCYGHMRAYEFLSQAYGFEDGVDLNEPRWKEICQHDIK